MIDEILFTVRRCSLLLFIVLFLVEIIMMVEVVVVPAVVIGLWVALATYGITLIIDELRGRDDGNYRY